MIADPTANRAIAVAGLVVLVAGLVASAARAAVYGENDFGDFGNGEVWNYNANGGTINDTLDMNSMRFTALENITVDRAWQRFIGSYANTTIEVGIMADDGAGNPTGSYLASGTFTAPAQFQAITFSSSTNLVAGNVYHLVTSAVSVGVGESITPRISTGSNDIRVYDRQLDPAMVAMQSLNGGGWTTIAGRDPFFLLANGADNAVVPGPAAPVNQVVNLSTSSGTGTAAGQRFVISDKEIPTGANVFVTELRIPIFQNSNPNDDLLVQLRNGDGSQILWETTVTAAEVPVGTTTITRSIAIEDWIVLTQGEAYLLTTQFADNVPGANSGAYRFATSLGQLGGSGSGLTTWGGTSEAFAISSGASNNWATFGAVGGGDRDLVFGLTGWVQTPEPTSAILLLLGSATPLLGRRTSRR